MAVSSFNKFQSFVADLANGVHNLGADTIKAALTNTAPVATNTTLSNITQISAGGGYSTGGFTLTASGRTSTQTSGLYKLILADYTFTATGTVAAWRYIVLYNDSAASDNLIGWYDYGTTLNMTNGEQFIFDFDGTNGVISLQ